ncbi:MAG: hypothetical protein V8S72_08725 [Oscillospiraceae bacterium]
MKKTKDTQYLYLSANIRAQENRTVGTQALHKMISAATPEEAYKTVTDAAHWCGRRNYQVFESALTQELVSTYERLKKPLRTRKYSTYSATSMTTQPQGHDKGARPRGRMPSGL